MALTLGPALYTLSSSSYLLECDNVAQGGLKSLEFPEKYLDKDKGCESCLARSDWHVVAVDEAMKW
ncbi:unnamed protein product [Sphenostylis stenocarpa]|uniref:Uncharacterized protein n=1 Tax=Sphenostylis stenocarpa TaxID=92480 RepID=A0AA86V2X3_9FABA|nr:unnamed protein product [Sphenostylis stenocarpa]